MQSRLFLSTYVDRQEPSLQTFYKRDSALAGRLALRGADPRVSGLIAGKRRIATNIAKLADLSCPLSELGTAVE